MTSVAIIGLRLPAPRIVGAFRIHGIEMPLVQGWRSSARRAVRDGIQGLSRSRAVLKAEWVDELYRDGDLAYLAACESLVRALREFEIVVFSTYNLLHPEIIRAELGGKTKVLGFSDDPHSTFVRGLPYLPFFDAAYYISPSYSDQMSFAELFRAVGFRKAAWLPLVQPVTYPVLDTSQIKARSLAACYVGNPTGSKFDRMARLKQRFGSRVAIHGRWPMRGFYGFVRPLLGESPYFRRVTALSETERRSLYLSTKIGFNMHVSDRPAESGNMRTYDVAGFGMMPLCDRGARNLQSSIFEEGREAIYYSSFDEAMELIEAYDRDDHKRSLIAHAAHQRVHRDYSWEKVWGDFLAWL